MKRALITFTLLALHAGVFGQAITIDEQGTVRCKGTSIGTTAILFGDVYEVVDRNLLIQRRNEAADLTKVCVSNITDMNSIFSGRVLIQPIGNWDVSSVTNMASMFYNSQFNQDISKWDISSVTNMASMFYNSQFNQDISNWDVSSVTNMSRMFYRSQFNQPIGNWDVGSVTDMNNMFWDNKQFNQDISSWDVSQVTTMNNMFEHSVFNQPIGDWDVSSVTNMNNMFWASSFNQPINTWCVPSILVRPINFSSGTLITANQPIWGTCPGMPVKATAVSAINNATDVSLSPQLSWRDETSSTLYQLQIFEGFHPVIVDTLISDTLYTYPGQLKSNFVYYWRVRGINENRTIAREPMRGEWSTVWKFTTEVDIAGPVSLRLPLDQSAPVPVSPALRWTSDANAEFYTVQITTNGFDNLTPDNLETLSLNETVTDTTFTPTTLSYETQYEWRVRSGNILGESDWSEIRTFTTIIAPPDAPQLLSPVNEAAQISAFPDLTWRPAERAETYRVQLSLHEDFSSITSDSSGIADTTYVPPGLDYGTTYFWRVLGANENTDSTARAWSETWSFKTVTNNFTLNFTVSDNRGNTLGMVIGTAPEATDGFDLPFDQYAPPAPPSGTFDARILFGGESYLRFFRATTEHYTVWPVQFRPASGGSSVTLSWSTSQLPEHGRMKISDRQDGKGSLNIDMHKQSSYVVWTTTSQTLYLIHTLDEVVNISLSDGWNLISLPVILEHQNYNELFSNALDNSLFAFESVYSVRERMDNGPGYWLRFSGSSTASFEGLELTSVNLALQAGWNLIGSLSVPAVLEHQAGVIVPGSLFGFSGVYHEVSELVPGRGYWVRTSEATSARLVPAPETLDRPTNGATPPEPEADVTLVATSGDWEQRLYLGAVERGFGVWLPPVPPEGVFDVRLEDDRRLVTSLSAVLRVQQTEAPVTLELQAALPYRWMVQERMGTLVLNEFEITPGSAFTLLDATDTVHLREIGSDDSDLEAGTGLPEMVTLAANYPNPFNPGTSIRYALPEAGEVRLEVYTVAGQRVAVLAEGERAAGWHTVQFDASNLASGMYLYRLRAGNTVITRKMTLVK
jgi:surface protein